MEEQKTEVLADTCVETDRSQELTIDFSRRDGVPLIKKFALFNSGIVALEQYDRDAYLLDELRTDSLRIDIFMGDEGRPFAHVVDGSKTALTYHFEELDALVQLLDAHGVRPYWSWCYIPFPLQQDGDWRKGPSDLDQWQEIFREFALHYKEKGLRIAYHEVYNEPDCGDAFFLGTMEDYTQLYIRAAKGLREGDPDAVVGGPSTAFINRTGDMAMHSFLSRVREEEVPLDFFSYHSYGCDTDQYISRTKQARAILEQYEEFDTTQLHLNEYNTLIQPFLPGGPAEHTKGGTTMLTSFEQLLDETDVTLAHWAQFLDTGYEPLGSVDTQGRTKAAYGAYWMYSQMPEERVFVKMHTDEWRESSALDSGLHVLASADSDLACILVWNDGDHPLTVDMALQNILIESGQCKIYRLDDETDPYWQTETESGMKPISVMNVEEMGSHLCVDLPPGSIVFYHIAGNVSADEKTTAKNITEINEAAGIMVRKYYYFPERGKKHYSFYDETDRTAYLGMNGEYSARAIVATLLDGLPDIAALDCRFGGRYEEIDSNTSFSVRVDYAVLEEYTKAVLYTFQPINIRRNNVLPWGTGNDADMIIPSGRLLNGRSWLMLKDHAPEGWNGRAIITYDMHSTGEETWAELQLREIRE